MFTFQFIKANHCDFLNPIDQICIRNCIKQILSGIINILGMIVIKTRLAANFDDRQGNSVQNTHSNLLAGNEFFNHHLLGVAAPDWIEQGVTYLDRKKKEEETKSR